MTKVSAQATALIPAAPERIYAILRDYENHHPRILPVKYFVEFHLEEGGQGAGTVFRGKTRAMGQERPFHMRVSEPEPGRRLVETDVDTGLETTFTVAPEAGGSRVTIGSVWQPAGGFAGWLERQLTPGVMRKIYLAELEKLAKYAREANL
jgi:uncharacterized protein YndB with AHSA1/START domain